MKKTIILAVTAALALTACSVKELEVKTPAKADAPEFFISSEDQTATDTKVALSDSKVVWEEGDEIRIFTASNTTGAKFVAGATDPETNLTVFTIKEGETWAEAAGPYWAAYPASATFDGSALTFSLSETQAYTAGTFAPKANAMAAYSANTRLNFKNVCGVVKLNVWSSTGKKVSAITFKDDAGICGTTAVTMASDGSIQNQTPALTGKSIVVKASSPVDVGTTSAEATPFYAVLPVGTFSSKVKVEIETQEGSGVVRTANCTGIARSQVLNMPALEFTTSASYGEVKESAGYANGPVTIGTKTGATLVKAVFDGKEVEAAEGTATGSLNVYQDGDANATAYYYVGSKEAVVYFEKVSVPLKAYVFESFDYTAGSDAKNHGFVYCHPAFSPDGTKCYLKTNRAAGKMEVICLNLKDKKIDWVYNFGASAVVDNQSAIMVNPVTGVIYSGYWTTKDSKTANALVAINPDGSNKWTSSQSAARDEALAISADGNWIYSGTLSNKIRVIDASDGTMKAECETATTPGQIIVKENSATQRTIYSIGRTATMSIAYITHTIDGDAHTLSTATPIKQEGTSASLSATAAVGPDLKLYNIRTNSGVTKMYMVNLSDNSYAKVSGSLGSGNGWSVAIGPNTAAEHGGAAADYRVFTGDVCTGSQARLWAIPAGLASGTLQCNIPTSLNGQTYANSALHYMGAIVTSRGEVITPLFNNAAATRLYIWRTENNVSHALENYTVSTTGAVWQGTTNMCGHYHVTGYYGGTNGEGIRVRYTENPRADGWSGPCGDPCKTGNISICYPTL